MSTSGNSPQGETPQEDRRTSGARLGLSVSLGAGEKEAIQTDPNGYIKQLYLEGTATAQIADRLEAAGADRRLAQTVVAGLEADPEVVAERKQGAGSRTKNLLISVIVGIVVYVAVVLVFMLARVGGLLVQIPALVLAIVLGRVVYSRMNGSKGEGSGGGPSKKLDRDDKARRLSR